MKHARKRRMIQELGGNSRGFTLIELLVVVGIIALLSAIAVPNYQNALARSKISKFMGDARAVETAIETFAIDNSTYPNEDYYPVGMAELNYAQPPSKPGAGFLSRSLTTPIAYLGKLPRDPFKNQSPEYLNEKTRFPYNYSTDTQNTAIFQGGVGSYYVSSVYDSIISNQVMRRGKATNAIWMLSSPGPDGDRDDGWNNEWNNPIAGSSSDIPTIYDPSNGTTSNGDLFMFGPSIGFPGQ